MKVFKLTISFLLILILSYGVSHAQETTLFVAAAETCDNPAPATNSILYRINPLNGNSTEVGSIGFNGVTGMAFLGDGRLVGSAQADIGQGQNRVRVAILIEINPLTGQGSFIGEIGDDETADECGRAPDLTYDPATHTLYASAIRCTGSGSDVGFLLEINQNTGQGTKIGPTSFDGTGNGLAIGDDGTLFWAVVPDVDPSALLTVNPTDGMATQVATLSEENTRLAALAFHPLTGVLFSTSLNPPDLPSGSALLQTVNTSTGQLSTIGQLPDCSDALIFSPLRVSNVPTLSEWGLIAMAGILGIAGFMVIRRRKVTA